MLVAAAVVLGSAFVLYSLQKPRYSATARVAVDRQQAGELVTVNRDTPNLTADSSTVDTEVQVIKSPGVAASIVDKLNLAARPGFGSSDGHSALAPAVAKARAIDMVRNGLEVQREGVSYAISITYDASDPVLAADIVNAAVDAYVNGRRIERYRRREAEIRQLGDRLGRLRSEVMQAESAVASYRAAANLTDMDANHASAQSALSNLGAQLATARAEQAASEARAAARMGGATALESPVLRELRSQQATLSAQLQDLSGRYGEMHPALAAVERQLTEVNHLIGEELARVRQSNSADVQAARQTASSIQASVNQTRGRLVASNNASVRLNELERIAESSRALYQAFLDRYRQNLAAQGTERSNAYIIALASPPASPKSPSRSAFVLGGLLAALAAAGGVALAIEFMEQGFQNRNDLEHEFGIPALSAVPDLKSLKGGRLHGSSPAEIANYLLQDEGSVFAESLRSIRAALRIGQARQVARTIAVTSSLPGEGKTTVSICLARSIARSGLRVVLVDCDVRRRSATRNLVDSVEVGLIDVIKETASLDQALVRDEPSGAYLLLQRPASPNDYDLTATREMKSIVDVLAERFDVVILDTAPVLPVAESRAIAAMTDGAIVVVQWRLTPSQVAARTLRELDLAGAKVLGTVLSQVDVRKASAAGSDIYYYRSYDAVD